MFKCFGTSKTKEVEQKNEKQNYLELKEIEEKIKQ